MDMFLNTVELKSAYVSQMMLTLISYFMVGWLLQKGFILPYLFTCLTLAKRPKAWSEFLMLAIETSFSTTCVIFHQDLFAKHLEVSHCFIFLMC